MNLYQERARPFRPAEFRIKRAEAAFELLGHHRQRHLAFVDEQGVFAVTDRDAIDRDAIPIVAVSCLLGDPDEVVGAVRIHEPTPGQWWGSRLCVGRATRGGARIAAELIRFAVSTDNAEACARFLARVQAQTDQLFERLRWRVLERLDRHGRPHALMEAELAAYPPLATPSLLLLAPVARAAAPNVPSP